MPISGQQSAKQAGWHNAVCRCMLLLLAPSTGSPLQHRVHLSAARQHTHQWRAARLDVGAVKLLGPRGIVAAGVHLPALI